MALPPHSLPWRLRIYVTFARWGWSEVYWLTADSLHTALVAAHEIVTRRRLWFGVGPYVEYAEVSQGKAAWDTYAVHVEGIDAFPPNLPQPQAPNSVTEGWLYRAEAAGGRWGQRLFRGVPDTWINDVNATGPVAAMKPLGTLALPPVVLGPAVGNAVRPVLLQPGQTLAMLQRSFLDSLLRYTGFLDTHYSTTNPATWTVTPLNRVLFRAVSNHQPKHAYRRMSCEPGLACVSPYGLVGPLFDFCGMCVGVARTAYMAPCRWYVDGPISGIRFYYVPRSNPVYYGRLRFGPKISEPSYSNGPRAGELTTLGGRPWYSGQNVWPSRDGTHPSITPEQAAGQDPWIWG